jgi:FkbM family methyltransferase
MFREDFFCAVGRIAPHLPHIRGRTRPFLMLFDLLGLRNAHTIVKTTLSSPVDYRVRLDLHSWLQRLAFLTGGYEDDTVRFLVRLHQAHPRRGHLFDIGANVGLISIPFSLLDNTGAPSSRRTKVYAFEAIADNCEALRHNILMNHLNGIVVPVSVALGDCEKLIQIQVEGDLHAGEGTGTANILPDGSTHDCVRIPLQLRTLDETIKREGIPSDVSVVKIDTDGYDLKVLQGGRLFLESARPAIFGEFSAHCMKWHDQTVGDVERFSREADYVTWARQPNGFRFSDRIDHAKYIQDLLLIPKEYAADYSWCLDVESAP